MPTDGFESVVRMATAFGLLAVAAVPVGLAAWWVGRRAPAVSLPTPSVDDPVFLLAYLGLFVGYQVAEVSVGDLFVSQKPSHDSILHVNTWRKVYGSLVMFPLVALSWAWFRSSWSWRAAVRAVAVGVAGWLVASPVVYAVHAVAEWASSFAGVDPKPHPLVELVRSADTTQVVVLVGAVAMTTPFAEEVLFRGLLLGWVRRRPEWGAALVGLAMLLAFGSTSSPSRLMAVGFFALTLVGLVAVRRHPAAVAVWATATLFAAVHSSIWPSPVPLFLLGLALGWVVVRTGGVLAGTVLHGLFNAVSLVYLLRG